MVCEAQMIKRTKLDELQKRIVEIAGLESDRLESAAAELQAELRVQRYDDCDDTHYPGDWYDEFLHLTKGWSSDKSAPRHGSHNGLTHRQMSLACAWRLVDLVRGFTPTGPENIKELDVALMVFYYVEAAKELLADALAVPNPRMRVDG